MPNPDVKETKVGKYYKKKMNIKVLKENEKGYLVCNAKTVDDQWWIDNKTFEDTYELDDQGV